jgi:hypothetical protein
MNRNSASLARIWHALQGTLFRVPRQSRDAVGPLKRDVGGFSHPHLTGFKLPGE